jgi:hypothetical protein
VDTRDGGSHGRDDDRDGGCHAGGGVAGLPTIVMGPTVGTLCLGRFHRRRKKSAEEQGPECITSNKAHSVFDYCSGVPRNDVCKIKRTRSHRGLLPLRRQ